ncbi:MAG TPA: PepSY domain-containing protein, partial [Phenylobacterium sp.]
LKRPGEWHPNGRTRVRIDPASGAVLAADDAEALGRGMRLANAVYPLHAAAVGGRAYDLLTFFTGLAVTALGAFGLWSFLLKPRGRRR